VVQTDQHEQALETLDPVEPAPVEAAPVESPPPLPPPELSETILTRQIRYIVAICSFAAGLLHVLAMISHADHNDTAARGFLAVAVIQIVWGALLIIEPRRIIIALGALATVGAIGVWVLSRTKGISWWPGLDHAEPIEWRDAVTQFFQLLAVAGAVVMLLPAWVHKPAGKRVEVLPIAIFTALAVATLGVLYAATHDYVHGEGGAETETHSH
jgi:hypothetical protein